MTRIHQGLNDLRTQESGQTSVLIIGTSAVVLLFASVIIAITAINLEARKLISVADAAAHRAAQEFIVDAENNTVKLSSGQARDVVNQHLSEVSADEQFHEISVVWVQVVDGGGTVQVKLGARAHPPIVNWIVPSGVDIYAEGNARTRLSR